MYGCEAEGVGTLIVPLLLLTLMLPPFPPLGAIADIAATLMLPWALTVILPARLQTLVQSALIKNVSMLPLLLVRLISPGAAPATEDLIVAAVMSLLAIKVILPATLKGPLLALLRSAMPLRESIINELDGLLSVIALFPFVLTVICPPVNAAFGMY